MVGRPRRRLAVGAGRARHEVAGGGGDRRRRGAGALGLAPGARRAVDRGRRRRGDRRRAGRAVDHQDPSGEGALRHARQRGRRGGVRIRRAAAATGCAAPRRACSASPYHRRGGRARVDAGDGRKRPAEDGAGARPARGAPALLPADGRAAGVPARDRRGPLGPAGVGRGACAQWTPAGDDVRADAGRHVHAHPHQGLGEDQRDPQPGRDESGLPRARPAWARRTCERESPRCSAKSRRGLQDRVHRADGRQPLADRLAADGRDIRLDLRAGSGRRGGAR